MGERTKLNHNGSRSSDLNFPNNPDSTPRWSMQLASSRTSSNASVSAASQPTWPRSWRPYACLAGCFFLMFNSWGLVNAYGTFASLYVDNTLADSGQLKLNLIGSTQSFLVLVFSGVVGRLLDAGLYRYVIGTGSFLVPFGMFALAIAHPNESGPEVRANYAHIWITQGFVVGLGMACFFVTSSQVAATWFPNRKGLAVGFVACGASIAGVIYPTMARYLIQSVGFNLAVCMMALLAAVTSLFSLVFATPSPAQPFHAPPKGWLVAETWIDPDAFKNKPFVFFSIAVAFLFFGFYPVFFNLEEWAALEGYGAREGLEVVVEKINGNALETFWLLAIMNGASTFGRLTIAVMSDKVGQLNMHIAAQLLSSLIILTLWILSQNIEGVIAFCILFGVTSGAVIGLPPASVANILAGTYTREEDHHVRHKKLGHWTGMMYTLAAAPALAGPTIAGYLVTKYDNNYITVQVWAGANLMMSAAFMLLTRWYLPCSDGEYVGEKLGRLLRRHRKLDEKHNPDAQGRLVVYPSILASRRHWGLPDDTPGTVRSQSPTVTAPERRV